MERWQWVMRGMQLLRITRYAVDQCTCGHPWSSHYQPRAGGPAACWETPRGVLCNCSRFVLVGEPDPRAVSADFWKE
ncbi:gp43 [Mycobacterium phage PLot]|uniref:Uncharacterized protein n=4 Tax=Plotvirus plot TaxID=2170099 RepID=Q19YA6_9CAUD|nr:gp43 [Mycobacterium phage PLot]ABD58642.1 hypothetical protein PBI_PLOT_43 [Mycobacterium phage PLot]AWY03532.1 hypothetical protein ERK16_42 [Mycobacterium phage Erk16]QBI97108.1 hypothetical protein SEA_CHILL_44 [Mycobacterium phage Chill]QBP30041.1 hypothetical protein SEA_WALDOWHY_44 [Mycobacterium phage WaldoWhy]